MLSIQETHMTDNGLIPQSKIWSPKTSTKEPSKAILIFGILSDIFMYVLTGIGSTLGLCKGAWFDWPFFIEQQQTIKQTKQESVIYPVSQVKFMFCTWRSNTESPEFKKSF